MINNVSTALKSATNEFCLLIGPPPPPATTTTTTTNAITLDQQTTSSNKTIFNLVNTFAETEQMIDDFPNLLQEALSEPNLWKRPFSQVKDRYDDISKLLRRIIFDIRFIHRCTTILKAEAKLHSAQDTR